MGVFSPTTGPFESWTYLREIHLPLPLPTGIVGTATYNWTGLPQGVFLNDETLVVYGAAQELLSGTFTLTGTDSAGDFTYSFDFEVAQPIQTLNVADFPNVAFTIGQEADYQLPVPTNGSGDYTYEITTPTLGTVSPPPVEVRLPDGISLSSSGRFVGTPTDTQQNRGGIFLDVVGNVSRGFDSRARRVFDTDNAGGRMTFSVNGVSHTITSLFTRAGGGNPLGGGNLRMFMTPHFTADDIPKNNPFWRLSLSETGASSRYYFASIGVNQGRFAFFSQQPFVESDRFLAPLDPLVRLPLVAQGQSIGLARLELLTETSSVLGLRVTDNATGLTFEQEITYNISMPTGPTEVPRISNFRTTSRHMELTVSTPPSGASVEYSLVDSGDQPGVYTGFAGPDLRFNELSPEREYYLWIRFRNVDGPGVATLVRVSTFRRAGNLPPPAPENLTIDNNLGDRAGELDGKLRLRWKEADVTNQVIDYLFQIVEDGQSFSADGWNKIPFSTGSTSVYLAPGLRNGQAYRCGIRARNTGGGDGDISEIVATPQAGRTDVKYDRVPNSKF